MTMPRCGTFDYVGVVPDPSHPLRQPWHVGLRNPVHRQGHRLVDDRLVGYAPILELSDAGIATDPVIAGTATVRPKVLRTRITLRASAKDHATASSVAFHVDKAFTDALRPGDEVFLSRTSCGGLAVSILRKGRLIAAAGAVTAVPLGDAVRVQIPHALIEEAANVFRRHDEKFRFPELPLEVCIDDGRHVLYGARQRLGPYEIFIEHGFRLGVPGTNECAAIALAAVCPPVVANASAQLLKLPNIEIAHW